MRFAFFCLKNKKIKRKNQTNKQTKRQTPIIWKLEQVFLHKKLAAWMSQEVSKWLVSIGYFTYL